MMKKRDQSSTFFLAACIVLGAVAGGVGLTAAAAVATSEELETVRTLTEAHAVTGDLRALPGGCPADGQGVVELATVWREAGLPAPAAGVRDGWGNPIWIWSDGERYRVVSAGADGVLQQDWTSAAGSGATGTLGSDIVFGDGRFLQWPEGEQS